MNIIEIAKQAGLHIATDVNWMPIISLEYAEKFAALVEAHEREECAALCFSIWNKWLDTPEEDRYKVLYDAEDCAIAIRARGTT